MSAANPTPDLSLILRQQQQLLDQFAEFRDDLRVMSAIVMRLDGTVQGLVTEVRAMHSRHERLTRRVERLEEPQS